MNLEKYTSLKSVQALKDYLKNQKYFSIYEKNQELYATTGTSKRPMTVSVKLEELFIEDVTGGLSSVIEKLEELTQKYKRLEFGEVIIENDKDFWQGVYEGETWTLIHKYEEKEEDFRYRLGLLDDIQNEIQFFESQKKEQNEQKEREQYLKLKTKFKD